LLSAAVGMLPPTLGGNLLTTQVAALVPTYQKLTLAGSLTPLQTSGPEGFDPQQIAAAYGFDQVTFGDVVGDGTGQTIAIIDAYNDPTIRADLAGFDAAFNLAAPPSFTVVSQTGTNKLPPVDPAGAGNDNWEGEEALDVEWAHALAPGASIILVEASNSSPGNLFAAAKWARTAPGVSVVSMSFGGNEISSELQYDIDFTTPSGHTGVTFVASTGDSAAPAGYPAYSPNVVAAGGTRLITSGTAGTYQSETGWSDSGGGISQIEPQPSYQNGVVTQTTTLRTAPDLSFVADPQTGVAVYDSYDNGSNTPWEVLGGTSVAAPCLSAMFAVADQGRVLAGEDTLDSRTDTLPLLYSAPASDFHDIVSGKNGFSAKAGYDLVTGLGSPKVNLLVPFLVDGTVVPPPTTGVVTVGSFISSPSTVVLGNTLTLTASAISDPGGTGDLVTFYEETNGTPGLQIGPGGDTVVGTSTGSSGNFAITINAPSSVNTYQYYALAGNAQGNSSLTGTDAPTTFVTVVTSINLGPQIGSFQAIPNPVVSGDTLALSVSGLTDSVSGARITRVYFYYEDNGSPGLQTGFSGDFAYFPVNVQNGFASLQLDTTGVDPGDYQFYALAVDSRGNESALGLNAPSVNVNIGASSPPNAPTNLSAHAVSPTEIDLSFKENDTVQSGFTIERSSNSNFTSFSTLFTINRPFETDYSDTNLAGSTTYYYRVQAFDLAGASNFSNAASATTPVGAVQLAFIQQPGSLTAGQTFTQPLTVAVEDAKGQIMTNDDSTIAIHLGSFPTGATLGGTLFASVVNGVATFNNLSLAIAGKYTLVASDGALKSTTSKSFEVVPQSSTAHLVIKSQPGPVIVGNATSVPLVVNRVDAFGNLLPEKGKIHLALPLAPANGSVSGATPIAAGSGSVSFKGLKFTVAGNYQFNITDDGLPNAAPLTFTEEVDPGATTITPPKVSLFYTAGKSIALSPHLTSTASTSISFTGTVQLVDQNHDVLATAAVQKNGSVSMNLATLAPSTYTCTIVYPGDANHTAATSSTFVLLVMAAAAHR